MHGQKNIKLSKINTHTNRLTYIRNLIIQGVSRLVDINARGDFLGLCDQKKVHINMCPILDVYGVMGIY